MRALILTLCMLTGLCAGAQVVINELGIAPSANNGAGGGEFIELYNKSSCPVNIGCYVVVFSSTSGSGNATGWSITLPSGTMLQPCSYYLIGGAGTTPGATWTSLSVGGNAWVNNYGANGNNTADLDISQAATSGLNGLRPGNLTDTRGQVSLIAPSGSTVSTVSYNSTTTTGNNNATYSGSFTKAAAGCTALNPIPNPGASAHHIPNFTTTGYDGIFLDATGSYQRAVSLSPGKSNSLLTGGSQIGCAPTITLALPAGPVCVSSNTQTATLAYTATTNAPLTYSITWEAIPANSFVPVTNASLPSSPITLQVPAGTASGTYSGNLTVSNAIGTSCPYPFTLTVNPRPAVGTGPFGPVCAGGPALPLQGTPSGGLFSGTGVSGNHFLPPVSPGNYSITYTYTDPITGCSNQAATSILVQGLPNITVTPPAAICAGGSTNLTAAGASSYSWSPAAGLSATTGSSVVASPSATSTYTVTGTDANGCTGGASTTITVHPPPATPVLQLAPPTCSTATGSLTITSPTGSGFTYSIDGGNFQSANSFAGIPPGSYSAHVANANGCLSSAPFTIQPQPSTPPAPNVSITQPTCATATGTITVAMTPGYSYSINGTDYSNTSGIFSGLTPGSYLVTQRNAEGCVSPAFAAQIQSQPLTPQVVVNSPSVCPGTQATITATVQPSGTYTYSWTVPAGAVDPGNTASFSSGIGGTYSVQVTGAGGCPATASGTLTVTPVATVTADDKQVCVNATVALTGQPSGGVWSGNHVTNGVFDATGLAPGTYPVSYSVASGGCSGNATAVVTVTALPSIQSVNVTQPACGAATGSVQVSATAIHFSLDNLDFSNTTGVFNNLAPGNYTVYVRNSGGCTVSQTFAVSAAPTVPAAPTVSVVQPDCTAPNGSITVTSPIGAGWTYNLNGGSFQSVPLFAGLTPGAYEVRVQNASGCSSLPLSVVVHAPPASPAAPVVSLTQPGCGGTAGAALVTAPSGAGLQYSLDGTNYSASNSFPGLLPGTYTVWVRNASGCTHSSTFSIQPPPALPATPVVSLSQPDCQTATGSIAVTSPLHLTYSIDGVNYTSSPVFSGLAPGGYTVHVKNGAGCTSSVSATILPAPDPQDVPTVQATGADCSGTGSIRFLAPLGSEYSYSINGTTFQSSPLFPGLAPGSYVVQVRKNGGCTSPPTLSATVASAQPTPVQNQTISGCDTVVHNGTLYTSSTILRDTVRTVVTQCDSIIRVVTINVTPRPRTYQQQCLQAGQTLLFNGQTITTSGHYTAAVPTTGCDSLVHLYAVFRTVVQTDTARCGPIHLNGVLYASSTTLRDTVRSVVSGCDSIIRITQIQISQPSAPTFVTACAGVGGSYSFHGQTLTTGGAYAHMLTNVQGCDSLVQLYLTLTRRDTLTLQGCQSVSYGGTVYTASTTLQQTIASAVTGCDSLLRTVQILIVPTITQQVSVCRPPGGSYTLGNQLLTQSGHYQHTFTATGGCDSVVQLHLVVALEQTQHLVGCDSLQYGGIWYTASTQVRDTIRSVSNCDSVIRIVNLQVHPRPQVYRQECLLAGQSYDFYGQPITTTGMYSAMVPGPSCDSLVRLYAVFRTTEQRDTAACGVLTLNGINYTSNTMIRDTLRSVVSGCDSLIRVLQVRIHLPSPVTNLSACIGAGQSYSFFGQQLTASGTYTHTLANSGGCDSTIRLNLVAARRDTVTLQGCSSVHYGGTLYSSSTVLHDTIPSVVNGCDSVLRTIQILITPTINQNLSVCRAPGQTYTFNNQVLTQSGLYIVTLPSSQGCDSVVRLRLVIAQEESTLLAGCGSVAYNGVVYSASTIVRDTLSSLATGCDSLIRVVSIQVNPQPVQQQSACIVAGQSYLFNGQQLTGSGVYTAVLPSSGGCDTLVRLYLTVRTTQTTAISGCQSVTYGGVTYHASTTLRDTIPSAITGCDSLIRIVQIVVGNVVHVQQTVCLPPGGSHVFNGQTLTVSGQYSALFPLPGGCDSVVHLNLLVATSQTLVRSGCDTVLHNGIIYTASTSWVDTLTSALTGCDSVYRTTQIVVNHRPVTGITACIEAGQTYSFNGQALTAGGWYATNYPRPNQCDSIVRLYLTVRTTTTQTVSGCGGAGYNGITYTSSVTLQDTLHSSISGCDSLIRVVQIVVHPLPSSLSEVCLSPGSSYTFNGQILTASGSYSAVIPRPNACDSIARIRLVIAQVQTETLNGCGPITYAGQVYTSPTVVRDTTRSLVSGCDSIYRIVILQPGAVSLSSQVLCLPPGSIHLFNGQSLAQSGQYTVTFLSSAGCDSTVQLHLTVARRDTVTVAGCGTVAYNGLTYSVSTELQQSFPSYLTGCDSLLRTIRIVVHPLPELTMPASRAICRGESVILNAGGNGASIFWTGIGANPTIVMPQQTTTYSALATSAAGCTSSGQVTITVRDFSLHVSASSNPVLAGMPVQLVTQAPGPYSVLSWQPSALFSNPVARNQTLLTDTTVQVRVVARSTDGCVDTAAVLVRVEPADDLYLPSAFTPNGDGLNDVFRVVGGRLRSMELSVYNRWGGLVFRTTDRNRGWDGKLEGKEQPSGTFVYTLQAVLTDGRTVRRQGTITLVR